MLAAEKNKNMKKFFFNLTARGGIVFTEQAQENSFASADVSFYRNPQKQTFQAMLNADIYDVEGDERGGDRKDCWIEFMQESDGYEIAKHSQNNGLSIITYSNVSRL